MKTFPKKATAKTRKTHLKSISKTSLKFWQKSKFMIISLVFGGVLLIAGLGAFLILDPFDMFPGIGAAFYSAFDQGSVQESTQEETAVIQAQSGEPVDTKTNAQEDTLQGTTDELPQTGTGGKLCTFIERVYLDKSCFDKATGKGSMLATAGWSIEIQYYIDSSSFRKVRTGLSGATYGYLETSNQRSCWYKGPIDISYGAKINLGGGKTRTISTRDYRVNILNTTFQIIRLPALYLNYCQDLLKK